MLLNIKKVSFLGWKFDVTHDGEHVASINLKAFKEGAEIEVRGEPFKVGRDGLASGSWFIEAFDTRLAEADKPSALKRQFDVRFADRHFSLRAISAFRREFVAIETDEHGDTHELGKIAPVSWYGQSATGKFDPNLPIALDVFLIALALLMWKRAAEATS